MRSEPSSREDLRLLYEITVSDLSYFKTQQWSVTNYCMLSYAALVGVATVLPGGLNVGDRVVLVLFALGVCVSTISVLRKLQTSVGIRQSRLDSIRENLGDAFLRSWSAEYKPKERLHAIHLLLSAVPASFALVAWLIGVRL
jgi:hypothetical protein